MPKNTSGLTGAAARCKVSRVVMTHPMMLLSAANPDIVRFTGRKR